MPWRGATVIDQKVRFVVEYEKYVETGEKSMAELCREHTISRKSGYAAIARKKRGGWNALADQSRAPHGGDHWSPPDTIMRVLRTRLEFPHWGAETIVSYLERIEPETEWPAASVAHDWLKRASLVNPKVRTRRFPHPGAPPKILLERPNQQWSTDFKGHFRTRDRRYCYPLTVVDSFSTYLIGCESLPSTCFEHTWPVFERLFREFGLPQAILSDNGTPFSSNSVKRLSKLSVRWIRLGIEPRLTQPGHPQQNGKHERIHGHMAPLVCSRPAQNWIEQQDQFEWFKVHHNQVRPNEGLGRKVPADLYVHSPRRYPPHLPEIEYPSAFIKRHVRTGGEIKWDGQWFFLSEALAGEWVAFEPIADGCSILRFGHKELGYYSQRERKLHLDRPRPAGKAENA